MAAVRAFQVAGVFLWFYSGDHEPPHFQARKPGHWLIRVYFLENREAMIELVHPPAARIRRNDRLAILDGAEAHRLELLAEWETCQG